jgi:hypothetical protein
MVTILAWLYLSLMVAMPTVLVLLSVRRGRPKPNPRIYQVMVELHAIRRRFDLAQHKFELRQDAAYARRALQTDLRRLSEREGS